MSILVVDDEESDVMLLRIAMERAAIRNPVVVTMNGHEAIRYLRGEHPFSDRDRHPLPGLLLVDLKMPLATGFDVLAYVRSCNELSHIPAIVLTSSENPRDKEKACALGAADYIVKPGNPSVLLDVVRHLQSRWLA